MARDRLSLALLASEPSETGLSKPELAQYSIARLLDVGNHNVGLEMEAHRAATAQLSSEVEALIPRGYIVIPREVLRRDLGNIGRRAMASVPGSKGGYAIGNEVVGFTDVLRNRSLLFRLGATPLPNLTSTVTIGRGATGVSATWQAADGTSTTAADQALGQVTLAPKTVVAITDASEQLFRQSMAEQFIARDLAIACANALDGAGLVGAGGAQPLGVLKTAAVTNQDAAAATDTKLDAFVQTVATANGLDDTAAFVGNAAGAIILQKRHIVAGVYAPLWTGSVLNGSLRGFPATTTEALANGTVLFGSWDQVIVADWGVVAIGLDRSGTRFNTGQVGIRALLIADVAVRQPGAFCVGTNLS